MSSVHNKAAPPPLLSWTLTETESPGLGWRAARQHTSQHLRQYLHLNRNKEGVSASNALVIVALDQRLYIISIQCSVASVCEAGRGKLILPYWRQ